MNETLQEFINLADGGQLVEFWKRLPDEREEPFIAEVEQAIQLAEKDGQAEFAGALSKKLEGFRRLRAKHQAVAPLLDFLNTPRVADTRAQFDQHPVLLAEIIEPLFDDLLRQYEGDEKAIAILQARRNFLRSCRTQGVETVFKALEQSKYDKAAFDEAVHRYETFAKDAQQRQCDFVAWRLTVEAGEMLLADHWRHLPGIDWALMNASLATAYNELGYARNAVGDPKAALEAFDRAAALQPYEPAWHRNRAAILIDLGRLDEAAEAIAAARALESGSTELDELQAELDEKRKA